LVANDAEIISRFSDNTAHGVTYVYGISVAPLGDMHLVNSCRNFRFLIPFLLMI